MVNGSGYDCVNRPGVQVRLIEERQYTELT